MINSTRYRALTQISQQSKLTAQIARLQSDISTTKKIETASDDPVAAARVAQLRSAQADTTTWKRNIENAQSIAAQADTSIDSVQDLFNRVKELVLAGRTQSVSETDRAAIVQELGELNVTLNNLMTGTTPTGQPIFPPDAPLQISVSGVLRLPATGKRGDIFDSVAIPAGGTTSLSAIITAAQTAISTTDPTTRATMADTVLDNVDAASTHLNSQRAAQGVRASRLDAAADALELSNLRLTEERSGLEDTDVTAAVMQLNAKTLSLQAAQAAFARVNRNTLFDFLS
ncbi:flagellin [Sphingomonas crocodyli]|uniref:Flagellin n=1 Tax=Sphingomonas crocodyli TaxID=1979270 RepID=A0A437MAE2_9SPHN|nr:flagellin [Sphingomonas crocodyli]RVT94627.1 flagellin [Sphingomonas crocodyli]